MANVIRKLGSRALDLVQEAGGMMLFLLEGLALAFMPPFRPRRFLQEIQLIGVKSTLIILLTAAFTGMVHGLAGLLYPEEIRLGRGPGVGGGPEPHPGDGPGAHRHHGLGPGRLGGHRRDRHHADHRATGRPGHHGRQPHAIRGDAQAAGRPHRRALAHRHLRRDWASWAAISSASSSWG